MTFSPESVCCRTGKSSPNYGRISMRFFTVIWRAAQNRTSTFYTSKYDNPFPTIFQLHNALSTGRSKRQRVTKKRAAIRVKKWTNVGGQMTLSLVVDKPAGRYFSSACMLNNLTWWKAGRRHIATAYIAAAYHSNALLEPWRQMSLLTRGCWTMTNDYCWCCWWWDDNDDDGSRLRWIQ